jgi:NAD(P)H-dependent flavin oxidoreductase YrpB (nitropropane dioxygenase family)
MPGAGEVAMSGMRWPDRRLLDLLSVDMPIIQAPMAGITTPAMIRGVARAGGLGSLPLGGDAGRCAGRA